MQKVFGFKEVVNRYNKTVLRRVFRNQHGKYYYCGRPRKGGSTITFVTEDQFIPTKLKIKIMQKTIITTREEMIQAYELWSLETKAHPEEFMEDAVYAAMTQKEKGELWIDAFIQYIERVKDEKLLI